MQYSVPKHSQAKTTILEINGVRMDAWFACRFGFDGWLAVLSNYQNEAWNNNVCACWCLFDLFQDSNSMAVWLVGVLEVQAKLSLLQLFH